MPSSQVEEALYPMWNWHQGPEILVSLPPAKQDEEQPADSIEVQMVKGQKAKQKNKHNPLSRLEYWRLWWTS